MTTVVPRPRVATLTAFAVLIFAARVSALCAGDCDGNGRVTVDELVKGVNIALETGELSTCVAGDRDGNGRVTVDELVAAVTGLLAGCPVEPVFPANYRSTYTEVRNCRFSIEHGGLSIRVLANAIGLQSYLDNAELLPVGSVIVKEEYDGPDCVDADLVRWRVMRKEAPGFDPADSDWHWQWVEKDRSVLFNDKSTCIGCHIRPECRDRDYMCTIGDPTPGRLTQVLRGRPAALLSITGSSAEDVYTVGADPGDGFGPYVLRYNGVRWRRLETNASGDLWWISVTPIDGVYYLAGANGLILRFDPSNESFEQMTTPGTALLFGVWGTDSTHIWAVGGDPSNEDQGGVVWRYDGTQWTVDTNFARVRPEGIPTLYKVWGRSENDVYVVGRLGVIFHFDGVRWSQLESNSIRPLFTVHGNDDIAVAVGGVNDGVILEQDAVAFVDRSMPGTLQMNGVFVAPDGKAVAVGVAGALALRTEEGWQVRDTGLDTILDFHSTWIDPEGGIWAVGGLLSGELTQGMLAYGGARTIGSEIVDIAPCRPGALGGVTTVSYSNDIVPIFTANGCLAGNCHGGVFPSSGYDLRSYDTSFGPGSAARSFGECEIVPGSPDDSFLLEKLLPSPRFGQRMPLNLPAMSAEDVNAIRTWIAEGAQNDATPTPTDSTPRPTATPTRTRTPTRTSAVPPPPTPPAVCAQDGIICTMAGTGQSVFDGDGKAARRTALYYPFDVAFDGAGRPLIMDWNNLRLRRIEADGTVRTIMGNDLEAIPTDGALATDTSLHHASDVELDADGNLYVADNHAPFVFRVGLDERVHIIAGVDEAGYDGDGGPARAAKLSAPFGVFPTADGGVYVADSAVHVVRYIDPSGIINTVAGTGPNPGTRAGGYSGDGGPGTQAQLNGPTRIRLDGAGNLFICDTNNHVIRRLDPSGIITTFAGTGVAGYGGDGGAATAAQLNTPYDLRIVPDGTMYVADAGNNVIRRIDPSGIVTTVIGNATAGFAGDQGLARDCQLKFPVGIEIAADGALWISDTFNQRVRRVAGFIR